ncbi:MAG: cobalamin B12-binding domain-containing protein [Candidatus Brocadiae bacterium]|nr:cobalamin B12-binding domain-containing protein [Candidatus Brocadiia bacterium]
MDSELLYSKFYQSLKEERYLDAKGIIYQAHQQGMPAGHILVKLVNRALDQMQKSIQSQAVQTVDFSSESKKYFECLVAADRNGAKQLIDEALKNQIVPSDIMHKIITPAMDDIGRLQSKEEISLSQIYLASKTTEEILEKLISLMPSKPQGIGKVLLGSAFGDYHSMGRKLVGASLRFYGFDVIDLGMSVPNEKFVEYALKENINIIFVSALLLHTAEHLKGLKQLLIEKKLHHVKLVAGGAPFNFDKELYRRLGCDATAPHGIAAVQIAKDLLGK